MTSTATAAQPSTLLTTPRLPTTRRTSPLPTWFFLLVAVSFLAITLSLLLTSPSSTHPCPYADVLGLESSDQQHPAAVRSMHAMPPGHSAVEGLSEDDCPHLAIERLAAKRRLEVEERRRRKELGVQTEEDGRVERREREEEDEIKRFEE